MQEGLTRVSYLTSVPDRSYLIRVLVLSCSLPCAELIACFCPVMLSWGRRKKNCEGHSLQVVHRLNSVDTDAITGADKHS